MKITHLETIILTMIAHFVFFGLYFAHTNLSYYEGVFAVEDGLVEWLSVLFLLSGAAVCFKRVFSLIGERPRSFLIFTSLLGLLYIFGAGEEISWGQRLLGIESPEFFKQHNGQGETNLHNLILGDFKVNRYIFGTGLGIAIAFYVLILPFLYQRQAWARNFVNYFALPLPQLHHLVAYLILFGVVSMIPSPKRGEILEFGGCALFFLITTFARNSELFKKETTLNG